MAIGLQTEFAKEGPGMEKYGFFYFFLKEKKDIPMISRLCEQTSWHSEEVREGAV